METNNIISIFLNLINVGVIILNIMTVWRASRKIYCLDSKTFDYNFFMLMFLWSSYFFVSNLMALYRGYQTFILQRLEIPTDLIWATYVDRTGMLLTAFSGYLLCKKYLVEWFFWIEKQKD